MATKILNYNEILEEAHNSWFGQTGKERAENVKNVIDTRLQNYHNVTGYSKEEILIAFEKKRKVNVVNFYQENIFPLLENVYVFETINDFFKTFPSQKYICSNCEKEIHDPYKCPLCGWKVYGLFRDLGKGIRIIIKDNFLEEPIPIVIFKPIEIK